MDRAIWRTIGGGKGGPVITLTASLYTFIHRMFTVFGSEKRANLALERLEDTLKGLRADVNELKSAHKRLELEWTETYDKVRHQMSRMARRGDLPKTNNDAEIVPSNGSEEPEMDPISAKIHLRRSRSFLGGK